MTTSSDRLIRVDMTRQAASVEPYPDAWQLLGGPRPVRPDPQRRVRPGL